MSSDTIGLAAYISACRRSGVECILEFMTALSNGSRECVLNNRVIPLVDNDLICMCEALLTNVNLRALDLEGNKLTPSCLPHLLNVMTQNPVLRELRLGSNRIGNEGCELVCSVLTSCGLRILDLAGNGIGLRGMDTLCESLQSAKCFLTELSLHNNSLDEECVRRLVRGLSRNERLKHLHLGSNPLDHAAGIVIADFLGNAKCSLQSLDLSCCQIGSPACEALCSAFAANKTLQYINLRSNGIDDAAMGSVAQAIRTNSTLKKLYLGGNPIRASTTAALIKACATNHGLIVLDTTGCPIDVAGGGLAAIVEVLNCNTTLHNLFVEDIVGGQDAEDKIEQALAQRRNRGMPGIFIGKEEFSKEASNSAPRATSITAAPTTTAPTTMTRPQSHSPTRQVKKPVAVTVPRNNTSPPRNNTSPLRAPSPVRDPSPKPRTAASPRDSAPSFATTDLLYALQIVDHSNPALVKDRIITAFTRILTVVETQRKEQDLKIARLTARVAELEAMHTGTAVHQGGHNHGVPEPVVAMPRVLLQDSPKHSPKSRANVVVSPIRMNDSIQDVTPRPAAPPANGPIRSSAFVPVNTRQPSPKKEQPSSTNTSPMPPQVVAPSVPAPRLTPNPMGKSTPSLLTSCPGRQERPQRASAQPTLQPHTK